MVVVPAVAAAIAAPLLTLCSARLERRTVLVGLSALVLVSDVIGGLAPGIGVILAARAVLGIGVGGFWVFGAGAALTLVSERALTLLGGPARPSALRQQALPVWTARGARRCRHRRKARSMQQETACNEHAEVAVRGHTQAAITRKELPCPTRW